MAAKKKVSWSSYTKVQLLRRCKRLGIKCNASMKKSQLVYRLARKCAKRKTKKAVSCKRKRVVRRKKRVVRRRKKKVIFSAAGKTVAQLRRKAKSLGLKQAGRKATVAARIRSKLSRKKK